MSAKRLPIIMNPLKHEYVMETLKNHNFSGKIDDHTLRMSNNLLRPPNTDMDNCLQQPGQLRNQPEKFMRETISQLIKLCVP